MLALLLAAGGLSCLFSFFLPPSASLLAPTRILISTAWATPTQTNIPTATLSSLPGTSVTSNLNEIIPYRIYDQRQVWESAVGKVIVSEDFETDSQGPVELQFPYVTGNRFLLSGKSEAEILNAPKLLESGNLLNFRAWGQGLTFVFPDDSAVTAFGFDYSTAEEWQLRVNNANLVIISGKNQFVGVILFQNPITEFTLVSSAFEQGGLSMDNISYVP